jgi:hypothetical protein
MAELRGKRMSKLKRWQSPLVGSLLPGLLCLAACTGGPDETQLPPATASPSLPSPSPTPTLTSPSPTDPSEAAAQLAVVRFWKVLDRLSADPKTDLTDIFTVARGEVADQYIRDITQDRVDRVHQVGAVSVEDLSAQRLKKRNRYRVTACIDVSATDLVTRNGTSIVPKNAPARTESQYELQKDDGSWYVVEETAVSTC